MRRLMLFPLLWVAPAWGFSSAAQFDTAPSADSTGGAAGIYFTGSSRFQGQTCAGCHRGGEGEVDLTLSSGPGDLFADGYTPDAVYRLQVDLQANRRVAPDCAAHPGEACDLNLFALEIQGPDGQPAGRLCPVDPADGCAGDVGSPTVLTRDGSTALANGLRFGADGVPGFRDGETRYTLFWQAPAADVGPVSLWLAAVDGDGARAEPELPTDVEGDATGNVRALICGPSGCPPEADTAGCEQMGGAPTGALGLLALLFLGIRRRRHA